MTRSPGRGRSGFPRGAFLENGTPWERKGGGESGPSFPPDPRLPRSASAGRRPLGGATAPARFSSCPPSPPLRPHGNPASAGPTREPVQAHPPRRKRETRDSVGREGISRHRSPPAPTARKGRDRKGGNNPAERVHSASFAARGERLRPPDSTRTLLMRRREVLSSKLRHGRA